jgi:O-antigen ligase
MTKIAYACLWFFTFVIPWENIVLIPGLGSGPKGVGTLGRLVGLVAAPVCLAAIFARGRIRPLALFHVFAACFVIWVGLTVVWSMDPDATKATFATSVQVAALPWLIWELASTPIQRRNLLQAYVLGTYVAAIATILNYQAGVASSKSLGDRFAAEGFNPNELGFLLGLGLPIAWHLGVTHRNAIVRWINRLYIPVGLVAILLTGSRSSMIGAALALTLIPLTLGRLSLSMKAGVLTVIVATMAAAVLYVPEMTWARLGTTATEIESGTLSERTTIWKAGLELFPRHPVGGVGAGAFADAVEPFLGNDKSAHNTFISLLIEQGVVGLVLFCLMLLSLTFHARSVAPEERRFVQVLLLTLLVGLLPRGYEFKKVTWLMFGFLLAPSAAAAAVVYHARPWVTARSRAQPRSQPVAPGTVRGQTRPLR